MAKRWKGPVEKRTNKNFVEGSPEHELYKAKQRAHYDRTKVEQRARANERVRNKRTRNQQWLINYLDGKKCRGCGIDDVRFLTFNHINPDEKHANIADLVSRGGKLEHLEVEVEKCEILCHNCHMLVTFKQLGGSYRETMTPISDEDFEKLRRELGV